MKKQQKKQKSMRVAYGLMTAALLTSCVVGGTFAKYMIQGTGSDSARVARFGVEITANGSTFSSMYEAENNGKERIVAYSVVGTAGGDGEKDQIVAPGTSGKMVSMTLSGKPEVAVRVSYEATLSLGNWEVDGAYYCPLEITIGESNEPIKGTDYESSDSFATAVKEAIEAYTAVYEPGTDLSQAPDMDFPSVSWRWAFDGNDDQKDTALGNQACTANFATVTLKIATTVTQIN